MSTKALVGARSELLPGSPLFPAGLLEIEEPVKRLYCIGDVRVLGSPALAIVGARKATPYGLSCAHRFARRAAQEGITVVSGGAIGCDQAAHRGALEGGGKTIVVLGCGADVVYPARAFSLFEEVLATGGAIVTEAPWGSPPSKWGFRRRNRIIAALAHSTLIVEAGLPSGTFSTADATLAQGKDVLVVPGSIDSMESRGSNRLLL
ncbi:MAG: DNA-protecting protein DprA, partial [Coriobacteriia bacterium]|nr:DNA-protecting protein DprA [Coriobacteriia bacterium]